MGKVTRQGPVWIGIIVVAVFFAGVTLAVAALGGGPDVPHAVGGDRAACTSCHAIDRLPDSHQGRRGDGCRSCHSERRVGDAASEAAEDVVVEPGDCAAAGADVG